MHFLLTLSTDSYRQHLPVNYQYPLSAVIYQILQRADSGYAAFLHNSGYKKEGEGARVSWHTGFRTEPPKYRPIAGVDIGSNSVRLVVYDGLRRSPTPVFNEKILCGLGRGVATQGRLGQEGITRALAALRRFRTLARQIGAKQVFAVATAAVRAASSASSDPRCSPPSPRPSRRGRSPPGAAA